MVLVPANARLMNEYITAGASFSVSTTVHELTVPAGKRYAFLHGFVDPDNSATVNVWVNDGTNDVQRLVNIGAGTAHVSIPYHGDSTVQLGPQAYPVIMDEGWLIQITYGAAQGSSTVQSLTWMEWSV